MKKETLIKIEHDLILADTAIMNALKGLIVNDHMAHIRSLTKCQERVAYALQSIQEDIKFHHSNRAKE